MHKIFNEGFTTKKDKGEGMGLPIVKEYENADYYDKSKTAFFKEKVLLNSITQELTSARLQQAIILSEIVGKPRSKTKKRRRF